MTQDTRSRLRHRRAPRPTYEQMEAQLRQYTADLARAGDELAQRTSLLDLSRDAILVVHGERNIVFWNQGAEQLYGWSAAEALGRSPIELLKTELPRPIAQIENILRQEGHWEAELKRTKRDGSALTVSSRWAAWRDANGNYLGRSQVDTDISKRRQVEQELRVLSGRLLNLRDEERRRLARDLHDSVGQLLAGAAMNLALFRQAESEIDPAQAKLLSEISGLLGQSLKEVRTLSYLLHPPLLDEAGLASALQWYVTGFAERSQIKVNLQVPEDLGRFRQELELAVFRIVQETLTNIHRHSGSPTATITVSKSAEQVRIKVEDQGKGMALPLVNTGAERNTPGVGLSGIRERVRQLGGQMKIRSGQGGTAVEVLFPLEGASKSYRLGASGQHSVTPHR